MAKKTGLGRGLAALLGEESGGDLAALGEAGARADESVTGVVELPVDVIRRNPRQPRRVIDAEALEELASSIATVGVVQPVIVRQVDDGYELIAGERRWLAAQKAGYTVIPAIVRKASDVESLELALIENVVRQQLNPVDEAYALKVLLEDLGVTQENLAARVGKSRSAIANKIRLLDLPAPIQEALAKGELSEGHGRALLAVPDRGKQLQLARRAIEKGLSVRQVEEEARRLAEKARTQANASAPRLAAQTIDQVRDVFFGVVGVVPRVRTRGQGGVIELPFKNEEDLKRILERLSQSG